MQQSAPAASAPSSAPTKFVDRWLVPVYVFFALFYLILPILVMIAFSFNDPPGKFNFVWGQFSLAAWENPFGRPGLAGGDRHQPRRRLRSRRSSPRSSAR